MKGVAGYNNLDIWPRWRVWDSMVLAGVRSLGFRYWGLTHRVRGFPGIVGCFGVLGLGFRIRG